MCPGRCVLWKSSSESFQEIPRKSLTTERILKAHNYTEYKLCCWCISSIFARIFRKAILKQNPMDVPYFFKDHLWMSASDEATLKKHFGGSKRSSKLTLKTKLYRSCGCCDDSRSWKELKKCVTEKYFLKKLDFES